MASSFALFAATCARTVTGEDSGELISAAYLVGVAHPPGYPLWCLLAKLATFIPIGEVAFRVALVSALFGALTIGLIAATVLVLVRSWPAALAASLGFGLMRDQWSQATIAEVYTLNTFFLSACILLLLIWSERLSWRAFYLFAFTYGLSLTNHPTMLGTAPPFLLFIFIKGWRLLAKWRQLLVATGCFLLGLVPYGYLPLAALRNPDVNWGNPTTFDSIVGHIMRRQYSEAGGEVRPQSWTSFFDQLGVLWDAAASQGSTLVLCLGALGLAWLLRRRLSVGLMLLSVAFVSTVVLILEINLQTDFENAYASRLFFVPAYLALAISGGYLVGEFMTRLPRRAGIMAGALVVAGAVVQPLLSNWSTCDYSGYRVVAAHARRLLASVPLNAVVFPSSDHNTFPLLYLRFVEGFGPDVTIGDKYGYIDPPIATAAPFAKGAHERTVRTKEFRAGVEAWIVETWNRPVFFSNKGRLATVADFELVSEGLWYRARRRDVPAERRAAADDAAWEAIEATPLDEDSRPYDYSAQMVLADLCFARARRLIAKGDVEGAFANCKKAAQHVPLSKEVQNNLGSLLAEHGQHGKARPFFERAIELDPNYLTGARNLALTFHAEGMRAEAREAFLRVLDLEPFEPSANRAMAQIAREEESWGEAAFYLEEVGKIERDARAFRDAGLIRLYELRELKDAKTLLRMSLVIDPNQPEIAEVEQHIKKAGEEDSTEESEKNGKRDERANAPDERERHARDLAGKALGMPTPNEPSVPDPLKNLIPNPAVPKAPGISPPGTPSTSAPDAPRPQLPKPGEGGR